jgi:autotransporter family porin
LIFALSFVVAFLCPVSVGKAATLIWADGSTTDWFDPANWNQTVIPPRPPVAGDILYIGTNTAGAAASGVVVMKPGSGAASTLYLGYTPATVGDLTVQTGASLALNSGTTVGQQGTGALSIDGGSVSTTRILVGYYSGTVTGLGALQISNGGVLTTTSAQSNYVSYTPTAATTVSAPSTVLIDGKPSAWHSSSTVTLGAGSGASAAKLTVQNGGLLEIDGNFASNLGLELATGVTSTADATVTGPQSTINSTPGIIVGAGGVGNLSVLNGATLLTGSSLVDYDYIGAATTLDGVRSEGYVVVDGAGSSWINDTGIVVGYTGIGTLTVSNGATVINANDSYIGATRGSSAGMDALYAAHGEVLITGQGSTWTTGSLDLAMYEGAEGILTVSDGGILKTTGVQGIRVGNEGPGVIHIGAPAGQTPIAPGAIEASAIQLVNPATSVINFNHTATVADNYAFSPPVSGSGAVNALSGVTLLTGTNIYGGPTTVSGGVLKAGGASAFSPNSDFAVESAGTLDVNGIGQTVLSLANAGLVNMGTGTSPGTVLTVSNDFSGNGGTINFNTVLGDSSSATDKLVVNGNTTTGTNHLHIANAGGSGALTTGGDGILVVEVLGGTSDGAFTLDNEPLVAGAYQYELVRGTANPNNWYLRSSNNTSPFTSNASLPIPALGNIALALMVLVMMGVVTVRYKRKEHAG